MNQNAIRQDIEAGLKKATERGWCPVCSLFAQLRGGTGEAAAELRRVFRTNTDVKVYCKWRKGTVRRAPRRQLEYMRGALLEAYLPDDAEVLATLLRLPLPSDVGRPRLREAPDALDLVN
ncbi:hypothetical protein [uncultured Halomonas sp.]|uniref:hypothetical protein n=1 Tax=uncultured Halomonas sp. TaxID=173971 RepID=UPI0026373915|nr:hypothetical protein [uncultured Halomonas sp.]